MSNLKERLKNGESVVGTMVTVFDNPDIVKMLKVCGFDLFIVDSEHGYMDYSKVAGLFAVAKSAGIAGLVRIPEVKREVVLKYMEMGADGLLLPNTETVDQAKALVDYSKYYPMGNRGVSLLRGHTGYEKVPSAVEYMNKANDETILMIQIESPIGVQNVGDILDVEGIDAAFIGPNDLSQSMGIMGQMDNPEFIKAIESVITAAKERNKFSGIHMMATDALQKWIDKGMTLNLWANDVVMLMNSARDGLAKLKK
ncbi:aldolase/citrate lyase family protein [Petroclostridium sp. X23]|jgi:2-dehydro-3-deoxyglucarate aldolase/4-hydroxy-2-oxoheptanedioate aldolase|uniref:HpcH/HpaI aldolase family protein n=1 Tax=Petroclostridium sp. X23 TaxID=3045146 RepID=UPI0024AE792D|nr:aldolase/citrate lyase family protein [Petroclostridium sp. X23]WHH57624.1 aldolase/citrate lyase family protein [Petroclostridium sp. X23]